MHRSCIYIDIWQTFLVTLNVLKISTKLLLKTFHISLHDKIKATQVTSSKLQVIKTSQCGIRLFNLTFNPSSELFIMNSRVVSFKPGLVSGAPNIAERNT